MVRVIKKQLVKRALDMLKEVAERPALADSKMSDYNTLWESFGKYIKLGALEDSANKCAAGPGPRAAARACRAARSHGRADHALAGARRAPLQAARMQQRTCHTGHARGVRAGA